MHHMVSRYPVLAVIGMYDTLNTSTSMTDQVCMIRLKTQIDLKNRPTLSRDTTLCHL